MTQPPGARPAPQRTPLSAEEKAALAMVLAQ
jgi:hypothetical protein